jgi:hypothetical protein
MTLKNLVVGKRSSLFCLSVIAGLEERGCVETGRRQDRVDTDVADVVDVADEARFKRPVKQQQQQQPWNANQRETVRLTSLS